VSNLDTNETMALCTMKYKKLVNKDTLQRKTKYQRIFVQPQDERAAENKSDANAVSETLM
jgi:hypothetical protein